MSGNTIGTGLIVASALVAECLLLADTVVEVVVSTESAYVGRS
jgi:hypothetical protein